MKIFASIVLAVITISAHARSIKPTASGNWSVPQTWNCNCIPNAGDNVNIPEGIVITITKAVIAKSIQINIAGELHISNGTIDINESDKIIVLPNGKIVAKGIGGTLYVGKTPHYFEHGRTVNGPATINKTISTLALIFFSADSNEGNTTISWASTGEVNIKRFEILSSNDSTNFQTVGSVKGSNNSFVRKNYSFPITNQAFEGEYYRLQIVKNDSTRTIISTVAAR